MQPRPRQADLIKRCGEALAKHRNTLGIAPTGAGKTVCASHVVRNYRHHFQGGDGTHLFLQHRDELVAQNSNTMWLIDNRIPLGFVDAGRKQWAMKGGVTYAMVQTLSRASTLDKVPRIESITVDEAHHAAADSYLRIFDAGRKGNPDLILFGVTATPNRGDKKSLRGVFTNVADQITIGELVSAGFLVPPRGFAIDVGIQGDLKALDEEAKRRKWSENELLMAADKLMNVSPVTDRIIEEWKARAGNRQTVFFGATVDHASNMTEAFRAAGVNAILIHGDMSEGDRKHALAAYDRGEIQVVCNVAVLTEGWDHQPTSCVILGRPSSYKSTMMQMIGRGLRTVDPERYPGIVKDDCIVLDFGTSLLKHRSLEQAAQLEGEGLKDCPECAALIPAQCAECPICGYEWPKPEIVLDEDGEETDAQQPSGPAERAEIRDFIMRELSDLLEASPYKWETFFDGLVMIAGGIEAWSCIIAFNGRWHALGGAKGEKLRHLADNAEEAVALAVADDFLRAHGDASSSGKSKGWLHMPPSDKQLAHLKMTQADALALGVSRYRANCQLTWNWNQSQIRLRLTERQRAISH